MGRLLFVLMDFYCIRNKVIVDVLLSHCSACFPQMMHPYVIDSSLAYNLSGKRTKRSSLKALSEIFLGELIQNSEERGHDPTEDAIASLKLIQFKLKNGASENYCSFGDKVLISLLLYSHLF